MRSPFASVPPGSQFLWLGWLFATTFALALILDQIGPKQIARLEFARDADEGRAVLKVFERESRQWGGEAGGVSQPNVRATVEARVRRQLTVDFAFIVSYSTLLAFGCAAAARSLGGRYGAVFAAAGIALAWSQWFAGGLDAIENVALLRFLHDQSSSVWPPVSRDCAAAKFVLIAAGAWYAAAGLVVAAARGSGWRSALCACGFLLFGGAAVSPLLAHFGTRIVEEPPRTHLP